MADATTETAGEKIVVSLPKCSEASSYVAMSKCLSVFWWYLQHCNTSYSQTGDCLPGSKIFRLIQEQPIRDDRYGRCAVVGGRWGGCERKQIGEDNWIGLWFDLPSCLCFLPSLQTSLQVRIDQPQINRKSSSNWIGNFCFDTEGKTAKILQ